MKRIADIILSITALIAAFPLMLIISICLYFTVGSCLFKQKRLGKGEQPFYIYKFKSMKDIEPEKGLISNEERITKIGKFIRGYSLDELPSLINILKGEMSFVGPRPLLVEYLKFYRDEHRIRHQVLPGLTGLAQVNGRNNTTWKKRLDHDAYYAKNQSFWLDLKIIGSTFYKVIKKEGVESNVDLSIIRLDQDDNYLNKN